MLPIKIQEGFELRLLAVEIVLNGFHVKQLPLGTFATWISHHPGRSSDQGDGVISSSLPVNQQHHGHQIPNVQGVCRGVKSHIAGDIAFCEGFFQARRHVMQHPPPTQFIDKVHGLQR